MPLIISDKELKLILERWNSDQTYKSEVARVIASAEEPFQTYKGPLPLDGVVKKDSKPESGNHGMNILNSAFAFQMTGVEKYYNNAVNAMIAQCKEPSMDFTSPRWKDSFLNDINPGFQIAEWLTRWIVIYDLFKRIIPEFERWAINGALFFQKTLEGDIVNKFIDREKGVLARTWGDVTQKDITGVPVTRIAELYNNRRGAMAKLCAYAGVRFKNQLLQDTAKRFFKEWMKYQVSPAGIVAESYRNDPTNPIGYMCSSTHQIAQIADVFARGNQDVSLYKYKNEKGYTLKDVIGNIFKIKEGSIAIGSEYKEALDRSSYHTWFAQSNLYYKDHNVTRIYSKPVPPNAPSAGPHPWQSGSGGIIPSIPLMYFGMEGKINPYFDEIDLKIPLVAGLQVHNVGGRKIVIEIQ